jgi:hypothetical protein
LKPERWGSPLVQEKYLGEKACDKRHPYRIVVVVVVVVVVIIIIIIIIELQKLDRNTRKLLTIHGQRHPKTDVDRLYVPRIQGGRGLMKLEEAYAVEITKLVEYEDNKEDPLIRTVRTHQHNIIATMLRTARYLKTKLQ